jgi:hypothetical protein
MSIKRELILVKRRFHKLNRSVYKIEILIEFTDILKPRVPGRVHTTKAL